VRQVHRGRFAEGGARDGERGLPVRLKQRLREREELFADGPVPPLARGLVLLRLRARLVGGARGQSARPRRVALCYRAQHDEALVGELDDETRDSTVGPALLAPHLVAARAVVT
jgi:hypothetical protein